MTVNLLDIMGSPNIGTYTLTTDKFAIIPGATPETKVNKLRAFLNVEIVKTNIGGVRIIGALAAANSHGILLPHYVKEEELSILKENGLTDFTIMETKRTAYGNMVLANDNGALVDPQISRSAIKQISETLQVEVDTGEIAGLPYVGSLAVATNKGVLASPLIRDNEKKVLEEILKVPVDVGTVNCGVPIVHSGLMANSHNAVVGSMTTGPELVILGQALSVV
ncbi:MAG TPA: translation initiation factor IF-6 [Candidatus Bathyarchaeia archaeon]|nr:translation initiation factor IF-6 [Candidatus Bathyarchaeia archaeon]